MNRGKGWFVLTLISSLMLGSVVSCTRVSRLEDIFSDLSVGVPGYESVQSFAYTGNGRNGDSFTLDFTQSSTQFASFASKLGLGLADALSPAGVSHISIASFRNSSRPWQISLKVDPANS